MPKERRKRSGGHEPSVKLMKREVAVQDNIIEDVAIVGATEASGTEIPEQNAAEPRSTLKKKEKHQLKRDAFLQRLETTDSPYSKSHARRVKRKAKEQIASGLGDMQLAIAALDDDMPPAVQDSVHSTEGNDTESQIKSQTKPGMIGEGKKATLSKSQRKRALQLEQIRHPLILSNPDFASNPFQTIRTHAQNTLLKHQAPA
ncbi:hypothetical protein Hypma_015413 [Hypsizygus marmoreus]|uniref:Ribosome biogenesis protein SLX9 n=1 Tax=Hypsizygus marmoreus TaxID=39966 RepID=A0A369K4R6_HYPMA|nr:hypothetical protein Hypma_015413 [Hypsizygus marmoreus]